MGLPSADPEYDRDRSALFLYVMAWKGGVPPNGRAVTLPFCPKQVALFAVVFKLIMAGKSVKIKGGRKDKCAPGHEAEGGGVGGGQIRELLMAYVKLLLHEFPSVKLTRRS